MKKGPQFVAPDATRDELQPAFETQLLLDVKADSAPQGWQVVCALVKPTIMARKMMRASRGADPRRTAEPRRAASRRAREVTTQTR